MPEAVRKALGQLPSPEARAAAILAVEAAQPAPRAPGAALMPPPGLGPSLKTVFTNADLQQLSLEERRRVYQDAQRGRVRIEGDTLRPTAR